MQAKRWLLWACCTVACVSESGRDKVPDGGGTGVVDATTTARDAGDDAADASAQADAKAPVVDSNASSSDASASVIDSSASSNDASASVVDGGVSASDATALLDDSAQPSEASTPAQPCSTDITTPNFDGAIAIHVESDRCNYDYKQAGTFRYRVSVTRPLRYEVLAWDGCGFYCKTFGSDVAPLVRAEVVSVTGAWYCPECDQGCCPPSKAANHELKTQIYEGTFQWPARSWRGPSDTNAPLGEYFQSGEAVVIVSVRMPDADVSRAEARLRITVR